MKQYLSVAIVFVICLLAIAGAWMWRVSQKDEKVEVDLNSIQKNTTPTTIDVYKENNSNSATTNAEQTFTSLIKEYVSYNAKYAKVYAEKIKEDSEAKVTYSDMGFANNYAFGSWKVESESGVYFNVTDKDAFEQFAGKTLQEIQTQYTWIKAK